MAAAAQRDGSRGQNLVYLFWVLTLAGNNQMGDVLVLLPTQLLQAQLITAESRPRGQTARQPLRAG